MKWIGLILLFLSSNLVNGQAYFQQRVATRIDVTLDDKKHVLNGFETFDYTNNSPDTLRLLYIHLWPNAYSSDETYFAERQLINKNVDFYFRRKNEEGYIDSLKIKIDGDSVATYSQPGFPDIARIDLRHPLLPGQSLKFSTPFRVKIPRVFSRMGHTKQAYYISQWFPKPAVYDNKGWHPLPYSDQGEFFSEIGNYDVSITLPKNYIVMATGDCTDAAENDFLDSLSKLPLPTRSVPLIGGKRWRDTVNGVPKSSPVLKTLHFHEENVHDFAWFADKRWIVRKDTMTVADAANTHPVSVYAAFLPTEKDYWENSTSYMKATIAYLSKRIGPYPYKTVKAVEGDLKAGGGMEYPTVTVVDKLATISSVKTVLVHELGHNWFYGMLATNERDHAWMDEGVNTFYEQKIGRFIKDSVNSETISTQIDASLYYENIAGNTDQAIENTASAFTKGNYGTDIYYKTALMLNWLERYMGRDDFNAGMKDYFDIWHFKHPYPEDLEAVLQKHTSKPIHWFFEDVLNTKHKIDFSIESAENGKDSRTLLVHNNSGFAAPVRINAMAGGKVKDSAWTAPFLHDTTVTMTGNGIDYYNVDNRIPDANGLNNIYRPGFFHRGKYQIRFGFGLGRKEHVQTYWTPAIGYNYYNGFMAGLLIHNLAIPENNFRYAFAPMYSFESKTFAGAGSVGYFLHPDHTFQEVNFQIDSKTFDYDKTNQNTPKTLYARYIKLAPSITFTFKKSNPLSLVNRELTLKAYGIWEDFFSFNLDKKDSLYKPTVLRHELNYGAVKYTHENSRALNPFSYCAEGQVGSNFVKLKLTGQLRIDYNRKNKSLYLRAFAGKFFSMAKNNPYQVERYWLTAAYGGANDYLYDGTYMGRSQTDGLLSRQSASEEGGFGIIRTMYAVPIGESDDWLTSLNMKTDLPLGRVPLRLYFNVCGYANSASISPTGTALLYEGGGEFYIGDFFTIHVPFLLSKDYHDYLASAHSENKFLNSISFTLKLQNINWLKSSRTAVMFSN